jgi:GNAT superfamily N-acetyltransferase
MRVWAMIFAGGAFSAISTGGGDGAGIVLDDLRESDIDGVRSVALASITGAYADILGEAEIERAYEESYSTTRLRELLHETEAGTSCFVVARSSGSVVGFVAGSRDNGSMVTHRLYVDPGYQGLGVGKALLERWERFVVANGESSYHAYVHEQAEQAIDFYLRAGFVHRPEFDIEGHWMIERQLRPSDTRRRRTRKGRLAHALTSLLAHVKH